MERGIMQTLSRTAKLKQCLGTSGLLLTCLLLSGCGHLSYVDPNPSNPYAFPVQTPARVASSPVNVAPQPSIGQPPVIPVARNTSADLAPVSAAPFTPGATKPPGLDSAEPATEGSSLLRVGDSISVTFIDVPTPMQEVKTTITEEGKVTSLPFGVIVQGAGKTPSQVQDAIHDALVPKYFVRLTASVKTAEFRYYFVGGEVKIPNRQIYQGDMTVLRAIDTAGGFTDFASRKNIELRRANGGKFTINYYKAQENPKLDLPVYANDKITVQKKKPLGIF
jgi:polysaccharide export outer membrane protein